MKHILLALIVGVLLVSSALAGPRVTVVHGENPSDLEKRAIDLLVEQLEKLFAANVQTAASVPAAAEHIILLGRPETNAALKQAVGDRWPTLSEQGHVLRTISDRPPTLLVGGGSDLATCWAVSEFGHHFGVRSLLLGDMYPPVRPALALAGLDQVLEPSIAVRTWFAGVASHLDTGFWTLKDQERLQRQLHKLKFNGLRIPTDLGTASATGSPAEAVPSVFRTIRIAADAPGRRALTSLQFHNADVDTARGVSAVGTFLMSVEDAGKVVGLSRQTDGAVSPQEVLPLSQIKLGVFPQSHLRHIDGLVNSSTLPRGRVVVTSRAAADVEAALYYLARRAWDSTITPERAYHDLYTPIAGRDDVAGRMQLALDQIEQANDKLAKLLDAHHLSCEPGPKMLVQFLTVEADLESGFKEVLDLYTRSNNEFHRAHGNAHGDSRDFFFYHSKRGDYSVFLTNCHIALAAAAKARKLKQSEVELEQIEKATESLYMAIDSLSEVARDQSDRGIIAVLNEWGYKPLTKELDRLTAQ